MQKTRRQLLIELGLMTSGAVVLANCSKPVADKVVPASGKLPSRAAGEPKAPAKKEGEPAAAGGLGADQNMGLQLYTFRDAMMKDAVGTLKKIAGVGFKKIETARSDKGNYYGLTPKEMQKACKDLGMTLVSGHVHIDENWAKTMAEAVEAGQEYLICSSMPKKEQTLDNYSRTAELFNKSGEQCKALGVKFGYHNHTYEFDSVGDQVLYDLLLAKTDAALVKFELDLGWVVAAGKNPVDYFKKYSGRFSQWHLKDMNVAKQISTEFGKGALKIEEVLKFKKESGVEHIYVEQEKYEKSPMESMVHNMKYLARL